MNTKSFIDYCGNIAKGMVEQINKSNFRSWREAAAKSQNSRAIRKVLEKEIHGEYNQIITDQILRNAELIKTIPTNIAYRVNKTIMERTLDGVRSDEIVEEIKRLVPHVSDVNAKRIARTEISKTSSIITQAKAQSIGLNFYTWETSSDEKVRSSHKHMQGVICSFNIPILPERYIGKNSNLTPGVAGCFPNCRCYPAVIEVEDINFPCKVALPDKIVTMGKRQFYEYFNVH